MRLGQQQLVGLLSRRGPSLHALMARLTFDPHTADDLMQDLCLRLTRLDCDNIDNLDAYARRTAINLAHDWRRRNMILQNRLVSIRPSGAGFKCPLETLAEREQIENLMNALNGLHGDHKAILVMRFIEGRPYREIAPLLGRSPYAVRVACLRAIRQLRKTLAVKDRQPAA